MNESRTKPRASSRRRSRILVQLNFPAYPIQASLGALGRRWALLVLLNIALSKAQRFNELLRTTPGMSRRVLAMRLRELEREGFISRAEQRRGYTRWQITPKGADILPVLLTLLHYGSRWYPPPGPERDASESWGRSFTVTYTARSRRGSRPRGSD